MPSGRLAGWDARICWRRSGPRSIRSCSRSWPPPSHDPPLRHQRLPAQDRRDPDDALGAVAAARSRRRSPCSPPRIPTARRGMPRSPSGWSAPGVGAAAHAVARPPHRRAGRRGRRRRRWCSTRPCRWGCSGPACRGPTPSCSTAPRSPCRGGCPGPNLALRRVLRGASLVIAAGGLPAGGGGASRRAGPLPSVLVPPGVDTERFVPSSAAERAEPASASACRPRAASS